MNVKWPFAIDVFSRSPANLVKTGDQKVASCYYPFTTMVEPIHIVL